MRGGSVTRALALLCTVLALALYSLHAAYGSKSKALGAVEEQHQQATARAESLATTLRLQRELAIAAAALDVQRTQELTDVRAENDRLRAAVAAGQQRLHVNATCPGVPDASATTRVADAGAPELTAQARQDYFALRDELALSRQMILGLQGYARLCTAFPFNEPRNIP